MLHDELDRELHDDPSPAELQHVAAWSQTEQSELPLEDPPVLVESPAPVLPPVLLAPPVPLDVPEQLLDASSRQEVRLSHVPWMHAFSLSSSSLTSQSAGAVEPPPAVAPPVPPCEEQNESQLRPALRQVFSLSHRFMHNCFTWVAVALLSPLEVLPPVALPFPLPPLALPFLLPPLPPPLLPLSPPQPAKKAVRTHEACAQNNIRVVRIDENTPSDKLGQRRLRVTDLQSSFPHPHTCFRCSETCSGEPSRRGFDYPRGR